VVRPGSPHEERITFYDRVEIGRRQPGRSVSPGTLLIADDTISRRHCIVTQTPDGRCFVRDLSRNGTRVDGRRLVPNMETPLHAGQIVCLGRDFELELSPGAESTLPDESTGADRTAEVQEATVATVLVGDIRDYTVLVRTMPLDDLQRSVRRTFELLTAEVHRFGGTVKEYQGDAIFAYWEDAHRPERVIAACRAVLELDALSRRIAADPAVWVLAEAPLKIDWALATGRVVIDTFGGRMPSGLSMIGEAVVRAFRIEKLATDETGPIVVCRHTYRASAEQFRFRDLGEAQAKGFDQPEHIFALQGPAESV
jgi:class 3 adenylate cyclase